MSPEVIVVDGQPIHCLISGTGPPIVLLHGSLADYRYWAPQMEALSSRFRVISPSLRHHFPEAWDGAGGDYSVDRHVQDTVVLIRQLAGQPTTLIGHSRGGWVALRVALEQPELLGALILADPAVPGLSTGAPEALALSVAGLRFDASQPANLHRQAADRILAGDIDGGLQIFVDSVSGEGCWARLNRRRRQIARDNALTLAAQLRDPAAEQGPSRCALRRMRVRTLLLNGERSPDRYHQTVRSLAGRLPDVSCAVIPVASHAMNAENAMVFNDEIVRFILATGLSCR